MDSNALETAYNYLELICDIAIDYDGLNTVESLKELIDEMACYAKAMKILIREGKYAALPCKLGEKLWCINNYGEVEETIAVGFLIEKESVCIYYKEKMSSEYYNAPIGKVLFLTREAAEEALKGENP